MHGLVAVCMGGAAWVCSHGWVAHVHAWGSMNAVMGG